MLASSCGAKLPRCGRKSGVSKWSEEVFGRTDIVRSRFQGDGRTGIVSPFFLTLDPLLAELVSYDYDEGGGFLYSGDLAHGVVEGQAQDLEVKVNGVASQVALRPAPVTVFDDETGISGQGKITCLLSDDLEAALLEQRRQRGQPCGADLFARPARASKRWVGHSLSSNGVG